VVGDVGEGAGDGHGRQFCLHADEDHFGAGIIKHDLPHKLPLDLTTILDSDAVGQFLDPGDTLLEQTGLTGGNGGIAHGMAFEGYLTLLGIGVYLDADDADGHPVLDEGGFDRRHAVVLVERDAGLGQEVADGEGIGRERACFAVGDKRDGARASGGTCCQREQE
jgi:hypothetical protein